jgi:hypothetical protein
MNIARPIPDLELTSCQPRRIGQRVYLALCPTCRLQGHTSIVEKREPVVVACARAHGSQAPTRRRRAVA